MDTEPKYRWKVEGLEGYKDVFGNGFLYTSLSAPVEADEYEHMKQRAEEAERKLAVVSEACATAVLQSGKFQTELVEMQRKYADLKAEEAHLASMCAAAVAEGNVLRRQLAAVPYKAIYDFWLNYDAQTPDESDSAVQTWLCDVVKIEVSKDDKELFAAVESLRRAVGQATYLFMPAGPGMEGKTHTKEGPL